MKQITIEEFIDNNQVEIDCYIRSAAEATMSIDNDERERWIYNDEYLYNWALDSGVEDF